MGNTITVKLAAGKHEYFVITDPDTGREQIYSSKLLDSPAFILTQEVKNYFLRGFPEKTEWEVSPEAQKRIDEICTSNCIDDPWINAE